MTKLVRRCAWHNYNFQIKSFIDRSVFNGMVMEEVGKKSIFVELNT